MQQIHLILDDFLYLQEVTNKEPLTTKDVDMIIKVVFDE